MSLHTWCHQDPHKSSSCAIFTLNSHWGRAATGKRRLVSMHTGSLWQCLILCDSVGCGLPGFSVKGVLQARILERIGQYWLPYPSRALYFLLPQPPTPLSTWCCQNPCDSSSCTTSIAGPHRDKPKSSRAASGQTPVDNPYPEVKIKSQLKARGSVIKEVK